MTDVMLLDDAQPPRRWSQADRDAVLAAAFAPGAVVSDVARQFRISTGQIYSNPPASLSITHK
jgi:transposase